MADLKISQLTSASTPLAGTEVLPIVQSGSTKKVSVDNLTVGKFVRVGSFQADGQIKSTSAAFGASDVIAETTAASGTGYSRFILKTADREWRFINDASTSGSPLLVYDVTAAAVRLEINSSGNFKINSGNLNFGTAGKGLEFSGNNSVLWRCGAGTPEGAVSAPVGSLYTRTDGGANTTLYVKESGTGNTGWVAK